MRVYHFLSECFALDDLAKQRLKVARWKDLNDPFELAAASVNDPKIRRAIKAVVDGANPINGPICFSATWENPVQWAHYGDRHRGVCLGFDIPDQFLTPITYVPERMDGDSFMALVTRAITTRQGADFQPYLFAKFAGWAYEQEYRAVAKLAGCQKEGELYFQPLGDDIRLAEIIVGHRNTTLKRATLSAILPTLDTLEVSRAIPALDAFAMVKRRARGGHLR